MTWADRFPETKREMFMQILLLRAPREKSSRGPRTSRQRAGDHGHSTVTTTGNTTVTPSTSSSNVQTRCPIPDLLQAFELWSFWFGHLRLLAGAV
jgi:hypothetical protein